MEKNLNLRKKWITDVLSSKKKFESWLVNNQEKGFIQFFNGSFRIDNDLCNRLYSGVGCKQSRRHLKRKLRTWGYEEEGETYKKIKIEENLQSNRSLQRKNQLNDKLNLFQYIYQQIDILDIFLSRSYGFEGHILKSSEIFIKERMKKMIPNDEMNGTSDLLKLYPMKKERKNIVRKSINSWRNELQKKMSDEQNLELLDIGSDILMCALMFLLKEVYKNYLAKISQEPYDILKHHEQIPICYRDLMDYGSPFIDWNEFSCYIINL